MHIVFLGPPGVGKGTQAVRLADHLRIVHLSTGEMLRSAVAAGAPVGLETQGYLAAGKLVPDSVMLDLVRQRLAQEDCARGYLLDGFPRTIGQALALDELLEHQQAPLSAVVELQADTEELVRRLVARGREDDRPEIIRGRLEQHARQTAPVSDFYRQKGLLHTVDGVGAPEEVFQRVCAVIDPLVRK